jgi:signal transduction histidine kinase
MRRSAWIFLAAILLPSLVLAFLAVRSARDQQVILQHQQAIIAQDITDALAKKVQDQVDNTRAGFVQATDQLLQIYPSPQSLATDFNSHLQNTWDMADVGFAVDLRGIIYSPTIRDGTMALNFRNENDQFLTNREFVEVFPQSPSKEPTVLYVPRGPVEDPNAPPASSQRLVPVEQQSAQSKNETSNQASPRQAQQSVLNSQSPGQMSNNPSNAQNSPATQRQQAVGQSNNSAQSNSSPASQGQSNGALLQPQRGFPQRSGISNQNTVANQNSVAGNASPPQNVSPAVQMPSQSVSPKTLNLAQEEQPGQKSKVSRKVEPQSQVDNAVSNSIGEQSDFRRVIGSQTSGALARFLEDKLHLMVWYRPRFGPLVFGAQIIQQKLIDNLQPLLESPDLKKSPNANAAYCLAILDDHGKPVLLSRPGFTADWKHPFVASEIGEALPHWEAALYLLDPGQINRSASTLRLALALIVAVLMAAILLGGWLMAADVRRQMRLAQQKTDFVSNVSHELKTPLTSIRMFADMLAEGRVSDRDRQRNYLQIISAESARLTRLINNVLDFARMERGAPSGERRPCDLVDVVQEVVNTCRPHLEAVHIPLSLEIEAGELPLTADRDALAQIMLNLISNAEKYGGKEILVRARAEKNSGATVACVDVLDRGPGIPAKKQETIFQPFQRLDDSLASGVTGSGLGLTLARRMARAHGGDVTCSPRPGGGSCFTLTVPLQTAIKTT